MTRKKNSFLLQFFHPAPPPPTPRLLTHAYHECLHKTHAQSTLTNLFACLFVFFLFSFTKVTGKYSDLDYTYVHQFLSHLGKRLGKLKKVEPG